MSSVYSIFETTRGKDQLLFDGKATLKAARSIVRAHLDTHPWAGRVAIFRGSRIGRHVESKHGSALCGVHGCETCYGGER